MRLLAELFIARHRLVEVLSGARVPPGALPCVASSCAPGGLGWLAAAYPLLLLLGTACGCVTLTVCTRLGGLDDMELRLCAKPEVLGEPLL